MKNILRLLPPIWAALTLSLHAAQLTIGLGTAANDGTGDNLRTAFGKVNTNFTELFTDVQTNITGTGAGVKSSDATLTNLTVSGSLTLPSGSSLLSGTTDMLMLSADPVTVEDSDGIQGYSSWPSLIKDGTTLVCFYNNKPDHLEYSTNSAIYFRTSTDDGATWSSRTLVLNSATNALFGVSAQALSDGSYVLVYHAYPVDTATNSSVYFIRSTDDGATWSTPSLVYTNPASTWAASRGKPLEMSDGSFGVPFYIVTNTGASVPTIPYWAVTPSLTAPTWTYNQVLASWGTYSEMSVVEQTNNPGRLYGFIRSSSAYVNRVVSTDYGATWGSASATFLTAGDGSAADQGPPEANYLSDGSLAMAVDFDRNAGVIALVREEDGYIAGSLSDWAEQQAYAVLDDENNQGGYASFVELDDGNLGLAYYADTSGSTNSTIKYVKVYRDADGFLAGRRVLNGYLVARKGTRGTPGIGFGEDALGTGWVFNDTSDSIDTYVNGYTNQVLRYFYSGLLSQNLTNQSQLQTGGLIVQTNATVAGTLTATNAALTTPSFSVFWDDIATSGAILRGTGTGDPAWTEVTPGSGIYGTGFDAGERVNHAVQFKHGLASTNAAFPNLYIGPHAHVSLSDAIAPGTSNHVWTLDYQWASINGDYLANTNTITVTNSFSSTNAGIHSLVDFGYITNNAAQGTLSSIFRFKLSRVTYSTAAVPDGTEIIVDSFDIHAPMDNLGSVNPASN